MNLLHLKYFYEVARTRSFTESARSLRVSQPAISKMVRLLEDHLGTQLLERNRGAIRVTEDGEKLFQTASRIFSEAEQISEQLRSPNREFSGAWTVGVSDNIALYLAPDILGRFKDKHPRLQISLFAGTSTQIKSELSFDRCRLGIFFTPVKSSEAFESRKIFDTEFWIVVAKENRWLKKSRPSLEDLRRAKVPRLESRHSDYAGGAPAHFHSTRLGLKEPVWIETNQHEVKKKLVLGGFGYSILTKHTVEQEVKEGKLLRVETSQRLEAPIYAVWRRGRELGRVSEAFLAEWKKALGERA